MQHFCHTQECWYAANVWDHVHRADGRCFVLLHLINHQKKQVPPSGILRYLTLLFSTQSYTVHNWIRSPRWAAPIFPRHRLFLDLGYFQGSGTALMMAMERNNEVLKMFEWYDMINWCIPRAIYRWHSTFCTFLRAYWAQYETEDAFIPNFLLHRVSFAIHLHYFIHTVKYGNRRKSNPQLLFFRSLLHMTRGVGGVNSTALSVQFFCCNSFFSRREVFHFPYL